MSNAESGREHRTPDRPMTEAATSQPIYGNDNPPACTHQDETCPAWEARKALRLVPSEPGSQRASTPWRRRSEAARRLTPYHQGPSRDDDGLADRDPWASSW